MEERERTDTLRVLSGTSFYIQCLAFFIRLALEFLETSN